MMTEEISKVELKVSDRCDRCGAQAFVLVQGVTGELMFCGHHYTENEKALTNFAFNVFDHRDRINSKPSSVSELVSD